MHPIQNRLSAIERHAEDVRRAEHRPHWQVAAGTRGRRPLRRPWRRRPGPPIADHQA